MRLYYRLFNRGGIPPYGPYSRITCTPVRQPPTTSFDMLSYVVKPALLDGRLHLWMDYPDFGGLGKCSFLMLDEPWSRPADIHQLLNLYTIQYA